MRTPDRSGPADLDRYWTALVHGASPAELAVLEKHLDPDMLAIIKRMRSARHDLQPDSGFVYRLENQLMNAYAIPAQPSPDNARRVRFDRGDGHHIHWAPVLRKSGHWVPVLAAAALLIALVGSIAMTRIDDRRGSDGSTGAIPAAVVPSPAAGPGQVLLQITLPEGSLPSTDYAVSAMGNDILQPGKRGVWIKPCCSGLMVEYVTSGRYTVRPETDIQVVRADGSEEQIAGGTETTLDVGDALVTTIDTAMESANNGAGPAGILSFFYVDIPPGSVFGGKAFPGWDQTGADIAHVVPELAGETTLTLRLVTLKPDETLLAPTGVLQIGLTVPGQTGYTTDPMDDAIGVVSFDDTPVDVYALTLESTTGAAATPAS